MFNLLRRSRAVTNLRFRAPNYPCIFQNFNNYSTRSRTRTRTPAKSKSTSPSSIQQEDLPKLAYSDELNAIKQHSSLLNQTTPEQIMSLEDIRPMMAIYSSLPSIESTNAVIQRVVHSLKQSAKDASYVFRAIPQHERIQSQTKVNMTSRQYLDHVASDVASGKVNSESAVYQIFKTYELLDPNAGLIFYENSPDKDRWGGAVIPAMLQVHTPFETIRHVFEQEAKAGGGLEYMKPQSVANMTLACLRHNQIEGAEALFNRLIAEDNDTVTDSIRKFLIDSFIGDAPAGLGVATFKRFPTHIPHHSAMSRLVQRMWEENPDTAEQIDIFGDYLHRLAVPVELAVKPVSLPVVSNIISNQKTPDDALEPIVHLCEVYGSQVSGHEMILNMILTEISQKWTSLDEAKDLILGIISNYSTQNSAVSFRVRSNSSENVSEVDDLIQELWEARKLSNPLQKWDWFASIRATRNGKFFESEWMQAGQPYVKDVTNFARSRRY